MGERGWRPVVRAYRRQWGGAVVMDIVERLRRINAFLHVTEDEPEYDYKLSYEAADEIEKLKGALLEIKSIPKQKRGSASYAMAAIAEAALKEGE